MTVEESKQYIRERITRLRMKKGVSEYRMSQDLGRSKGYIQGVSSGKSLPSMDGFLNICSYLGVSTRDFFDSEAEDPSQLNRLVSLAKKLTPDDIMLLINFAEALVRKKLPDDSQEASSSKN